MADFELARESIEEVFDYPTIISTFEGQTEQRRLRSSKKLLGFRIKSSALIQAQMQQWRAFVSTYLGATSTFTFTSPFDSITYNVRLAKGSYRCIFQGGVYRCELELVVVSAI